MRRGGILLLVIVLLILVLSVGAFLMLGGGGGLLGGAQAEPTQPLSTIVILAQPLQRDDLIVAAALEEIPYPEDKITAGMIRNKAEVADIYYAKYPLTQGQPLTRDLLAERPGLLQEGSEAAKTIPAGMTAISIPISRLGAVGYAIKDGDRVNVIATTTFVDLDTSFQSLLPNNMILVTGPAPLGTKQDELPRLTIGGGDGAALGRAELDPALNQAVYMTPSESQRPRLVSQMILQNIQVLKVGQTEVAQPAATQDAAAQTQGAEGETTQTAPPPPDMVTLIVTPQDAITLTYLIYSNARLTLTLRSPDDPNLFDTESVTLQFLISQYNIALPAKLPFGLNPRLDELVDPIP
jgi:pilus assembly protein CpaB